MADDLDSLLDRMSSDLAQSLVPIYRQPPKGRLDHEGTGVLIRWRGCFYVVTAAHVVDALDDAIPVVGIADRLFPMSGRVVRSRLPSSGDRESDTLDFAAFPVPPEALKLALPAYVPEASLDLVWDIEPDRDYFFVLGFPNTKQDLRVQDETLEPYVYRLLATADQPSIDPRFGTPTQLALTFKRKDIFVDGQQRVAPKLRGVSGGAVWRLPVGSANAGPPRLSAIFTGHSRRDKRLLATRISCHLDAIDNAGFVDCGENAQQRDVSTGDPPSSPLEVPVDRLEELEHEPVQDVAGEEEGG